MEEIIFNKDEIENYGIEITSVSSFIDEVNKLKDDLHGSNEELFFRGQKTDFGMLFQASLEVIFKCRT